MKLRFGFFLYLKLSAAFRDTETVLRQIMTETERGQVENS